MKKIIVIGGGAAGMAAAIAAAENGCAATIYEKNEKLGKKIYITGKGRCNVTNDCDMEEKELNKEGLETYYEELGTTLGEALLAPTRIYVKALKAVKNAGVTVKACSHITGGGFYENVPRMLKDGVRAVIKKDSYQIPPIFGMLAKKGDIEEHMMYNTYNMGIGMVVAVDAADAERAMEAMKSAGDTPYIIGSIEAGEKGVTLC